MALPQSLGIVPFYVGDACVIILKFTNQDFSAFTFVSQIRQQATSEAVLATFHVTQLLLDGSTLLIFYLLGDSRIGTPDGETRKPGLTNAVFDIEKVRADGTLERTVFTGALSGTQDVTR